MNKIGTGTSETLALARDLDIDLQTTLQIVTSKAHNVTKSHSGSVKLNEIFYDLINDLP